MSHGCNAGLPNAYNLVKPVKDQFPELGWADLFQVGGRWRVGAGGWALAGGRWRVGAGGCWGDSHLYWGHCEVADELARQRAACSICSLCSITHSPTPPPRAHPAASRPPRRRLCLLLQLASAVAIEEAGGPFIPLRLGRKDAQSEEECTPDGRLPNAAAPFPDKAANPAGVGAWLPPASHPVLLLAHCCCCAARLSGVDASWLLLARAGPLPPCSYLLPPTPPQHS